MLTKFTRSFLLIVLILIVLATLLFVSPPARTYLDPWTGDVLGEGGIGSFRGSNKESLIPEANLHGSVIMGKLGNATAKAALGQATWKLMHTMTLRFPEHPTQDMRDALSSYFYLQARLYPCGECAEEFQKLLQKYPPQTSSRKAAAGWLCHVHNQVNHRLGKPEFDCAHLDETYDCGCADDEPSTASDARQAESTNEDSDTGLALMKGGR